MNDTRRRDSSPSPAATQPTSAPNTSGAIFGRARHGDPGDRSPLEPDDAVENLLDALAETWALFDPDGKLVSKSENLLDRLGDPTAQATGLWESAGIVGLLAATGWAPGEPTGDELSHSERAGLYVKDGRYLECREHLLARGATVAVLKDVSAEIDEAETRRRIEESERNLRQIADNVPVGIIHADKDLRYRFMNRTNAGWIEKDPLEVVGKTVPEVLRPEIYAVLKPHIERVLAGQEHRATVEIPLSPEETRSNEVHYRPEFAPDGSVAGYYALYHDITARVRSEKALRLSEGRFRGVFEHGPLGINLVDKDLRLIAVNQRFCEMTGFEESDILGRSVMDITHPEDVEADLARSTALLQGGRTNFQLEKRYLKKDGGFVTVNLSATIVRGDDGNVLYGIGMAEDITERRKAEIERAEYQRYLDLTLETMDQGITIYDENFELVAWNKRYTEMQVSPPECLVKGYKLVDLYEKLAAVGIFGPGDPREQAEGHVDALRQGNLKVREVLTPPSGRLIEIYRFLLPEGGVCALFTDVTEETRQAKYRTEMETRLQQAQKLRTISSFAGGVVHEINQPLAAIANYLRVGQRQLAKTPEDRDAGLVDTVLEKAVGQAERAGAIVDGLRRFIRNESLEPQPEQVNEVVQEAMSLGVLRDPNRRGAVKLDLAEGLPLAEIDRTQIQQVVINLVQNAVDALVPERAGEIRISTALNADGEILVTVQDNGSGICAGAMKSLFQPFVTSKSAGMGLGLSISRKIVEAHGGRLWCEDHEGLGARFAFTLPAVRQEEAGLGG